jgi:hypothetical protein
LKSKHLTIFLILTQCTGVIFYGVFSAAYMLALPSVNVLTGVPIFHFLLSVFGGLFLFLIIGSVLLSIAVKTKE